jgi:hypothetical protein
MKRITTNRTFENFSFPVSFADVSATVAGLASIVAVNQDNALPEHLSFVSYKTEELFSTPTSNKLSGLPACFSFPLHTSCSQNFKGDSITIFVNDCFTDAVVCISDEPSLSTSQMTQMPFGRASACSLKTTLQMPVSSLDFSKLSAVEKSVIRSDSRVINPPVNTNDILNLLSFWSDDFSYNVNEYPSFFSSDSCRFRTPEIILGKIRGDFDSILFSSIDSADAHKIRVCEKPESVMIEPYAGILFFSGLNLEFEPFEHIACLVSDSSHETAVKLWMSLPDNPVSEMMQSGLVEGIGFHSNIYTLLTGLIAQLDCVSQVIVSDDFSSDCYIHNNPLKHNLYIYIVFLCSNENQKNKAFSLQHQLSFSVVSEISKESIGWRSQGFSQENNQGSMHYKGVGAYQLISPARPSACFSICFSNIQPNVCSESFEGNNSSEGCQGASFRKEILESELLCWDSRNSHGTDYSEVCSRTRKKEVNKQQFTTATRLQCPLVA